MHDNHFWYLYPSGLQPVDEGKTYCTGLFQSGMVGFLSESDCKVFTHYQLSGFKILRGVIVVMLV